MNDSPKFITRTAVLENSTADTDQLGIYSTVALGLMLLFAAGSEQIAALHDLRHSTAFPDH